MKGEYFSEEDVFSMLGGLNQRYFMGRKPYYRLNNGDYIVIRKNALLATYYWYNVQCDLFHSDVQYVVCVAGYEGVYRIPLSDISRYAEEGQLSVEKDGRNYKLQLKRYSEKMCLHLKGAVEPVDIEQYQVYRQAYEKTTEIALEQALSLSEGTKKTVIVNAYERNPIARRKCIEYYGTKCQVCGFDFKETYGSEYEGLIEVHHLVTVFVFFRYAAKAS